MSIQPVFSNRIEIRMGSPYSCCDLAIDGDNSFDLPERNWQDKWSRSDDGRYVALVAWDTLNNGPGFRIVVLDTFCFTVVENDRNDGCCDSIFWSVDHFAWTAFPEGNGIVCTDRSA